VKRVDPLTPHELHRRFDGVSTSSGDMCEKNPRRSAVMEKETKKYLFAFLIKCARRIGMEAVAIAAAAMICQRFFALVSLCDINRFVSKLATPEQFE